MNIHCDERCDTCAGHGSEEGKPSERGQDEVELIYRTPISRLELAGHPRHLVADLQTWKRGWETAVVGECVGPHCPTVPLRRYDPAARDPAGL